MSRETYATLCCCCCCGGLPILAVVKAAFGIPFSLLIMTGGCTLGAILMLPHDVFLTYRAVLGTGLIGPNLKVLTMLVLPIALALWPCIVAFASAIIAIIWPIAVALQATFDSDQNICFGGCLFDGDGACPSIRFAVNSTKDYWDFNYHSMFDYLYEIRNGRTENPFDIAILSLIVGTIQAILCCVWLMTISVIMIALKGAFIILVAYYRLLMEAMKTLIENKFGLTLEKFFVVWVIGLTVFAVTFVLIPVIFALFCGVLICSSGYFGIDCAIKAYRHGFCAGFKQAINHSRTIDIFTTWIVVTGLKGESGSDENIFSCFPKFDLRDSEWAGVESPPEVIEREQSAVRNALGSVPMQQVWDNFFTQCEVTIRRGLKRGIIKQDDIDSFATFIFIGVPAAVVIRCASNSNDHDSGTDVLKFSDGLLMTPENRPDNYIANMFYNPMVKLKRDMNRKNLDKEQIDAVWDAVLCQNSDLISGMDSDPKDTELFSQATRMGILVSRLPQFRRRFNDAIKNSAVEKSI